VTPRSVLHLSSLFANGTAARAKTNSAQGAASITTTAPGTSPAAYVTFTSPSPGTQNNQLMRPSPTTMMFEVGSSKQGSHFSLERSASQWDVRNSKAYIEAMKAL
jgi:hypothetical protein